MSRIDKKDKEYQNEYNYTGSGLYNIDAGLYGGIENNKVEGFVPFIALPIIAVLSKIPVIGPIIKQVGQVIVASSSSSSSSLSSCCCLLIMFLLFGFMGGNGGNGGSVGTRPEVVYV